MECNASPLAMDYGRGGLSVTLTSAATLGRGPPPVHQCTNSAIRIMTGMGTPRKNSRSERMLILLLTQGHGFGGVVFAGFQVGHAIALATAERGGEAGEEGTDEQRDKHPQG